MKPKVLVFIDWFLPGYKAGGPIKSVLNIILNLHVDFDFSVVTSNKDFGAEHEYESITPNVWMDHGRYKIIYLNEKHQNIGFIRSLISEKNYDFIYLNSLFSINFTLLPLLVYKIFKGNGTIVLAPRGMLGDGALQLKKTKKKIFIKAAKLIGLFKNITWHASTHIEAGEIINAFGEKANIKIARNIASKVEDLDTLKFKTPYTAAFFFLSRISPKKNLAGALEAMKLADTSFKFNFDIIGPVEDKNYWDTCLQLINDLPDNVTVNYLGDVPNHSLGSLLKKYHFLILPTFNENYGHVIVEAWTYGCPVILSDQTPWNDLERHNVGWNFSLNEPGKLVKLINSCVLMDNEEYQHMRRHIKTYLNREVVSEEIIEQNRKLFCF